MAAGYGNEEYARCFGQKREMEENGKLALARLTQWARQNKTLILSLGAKK
jgi:hypothetical protein